MSEYELTAADVDMIRDHLDIDEEDIRTDYSGRGMYGGRCLGFVGHDCTRFAFELAVVIARGNAGLDDDGSDDDELRVDDIRAALEDIGDPTTDGMGTQTVFYWRNITVADDDREPADA